jgi:hypothetical protein
MRSTKYEALNTKQTQNPKYQNPNNELVLSLRILDLFRISNLGFRISAK